MAVGSAVVLWWARMPMAVCRPVLEGAVLEFSRRGRDEPVLT
jgi:adenine-specific DNA methylase